MSLKDRLVGKLISSGPVGQLTERIKELEAEVQEIRQQNLRLAELADVVEELLIPMASRDQARIDAAVEAYLKSV
ncbi:MAG: DUF6752 domain-containing protein [Marmoricola sp.]|jgi:hypothetical protein